LEKVEVNVDQKELTLDIAYRKAYVLIMTTISATKARSQLYKLIDEANDSHEPIQITGKRGNAVLLSETDWSAIQETLYLNSIPGMIDSIQQARKEGLDQASETLDW
jgi:prevent-host-death family protein